MKRVYEDAEAALYEIQSNFRECVDFVYNLNGNDELKDSEIISKFTAFLITHQNKLYTYSNDIEVILDTYSNKNDKFYGYSLEDLTKKLDSNSNW